MNVMKTVVWFCGLTLAGGLSAATLHVETKGSDAGDGSAAKPFATVGRAVAALRELRAKSSAEPVEIRLGAGFFELERTVELTAADTTAPVAFTGAGADRTVLSGGRRLKLKESADLRTREVRLPEVARGEWSIEQLYVNGRRVLRPTLPRGGYYLAWGVAPGLTITNAAYDRFTADVGHFNADWPDLTNGVEIVLMHGWNISRLRVKAYDPVTRGVTLEGGRKGFMRNIDNRMTYRLENVRAAFGEAADEWYCDRASGRLLYLPLPTEDRDRLEVVAPRLPALFLLAGKPGARVKDVTLSALTLAHQSETLVPGGTAYSQTSAPAGGAFVARQAERIVLRDVAVKHTGGWGVKFCEGCSGCAVEDSLLYDLGAGGVLVGADLVRAVRRKSTNWSHHCRVTGCEIYGYGRVQAGGPGVNLLVAGYCTVRRNVIHDGYYSGISSGFEWGYGGDGAVENLIADNHIYDIGQGRLSDLGGIYTLGEHQGTVLSGNCMHDITRASYGAEGFYFDQGSSNIRITSNVVYRTQDAPYNVSSPNKNIRADNNVFGFTSSYFLTAPQAKDKNAKVSTGNLCERCVMLYDERMRSLFPKDRGPVDTNGTVFARNVWIKSDKRNLDGQALMPAADDKVACAEGFRPFVLDVPTARPGLRPATHTFPVQPPRNHAKRR